MDRAARLRQGLGRRLLAHAARVARLAGAREIAIEADPQAEPFYLAQGAVRVGARAAPFPANPDARCRCCTCR